MKRSAFLCALAVAALTMGAPARAHHSFAMYDASKPLVLSATVKEFQWSNPHVILWLTADPKPGQKEGDTWIIELSTSTGPLSRIGWSKRSLEPGDRVLVEINPLRSGELGGQFRKLTIPKTGVVLTTALPNPDDVPLPASAARP
jgi:D-serine deaminase-like pyridoxal phosphate-dependent protein